MNLIDKFRIFNFLSFWAAFQVISAYQFSNLVLILFNCVLLGGSSVEPFFFLNFSVCTFNF